MDKYLLRKDQKEAVDWVLSYNDNRPIALLASTGAGKTYIAKYLADAIPGKIAIITYANFLVRQFRQTFSIPTIIGKCHYRTEDDYSQAYDVARDAKIVLFNPVSYMNYIKGFEVNPFSTVIIDEMDACLSLFKLLTPTTILRDSYDMPGVEEVVAALEQNGAEYAAKQVRHHQQNFWWEVVEQYTKSKKVKYALKIHEVILSPFFARDHLPEKVIGLSGTLLPSYCSELFGTKQYHYFEMPSPIPIERRKVTSCVLDEPWDFPTNYNQMIEIIDVVLSRFQERPAIFHTTYTDVVELQAIRQYLDGYDNKSDKRASLETLQGTDKYLLSPGATTGIDLKDDKCRLNCIVRGVFPSLGNIAVQKRKALVGGEQWYIEQVLREAVQAAGRATRGPEDFSKIVISDRRLTRLIKTHQSLCPKYFIEACDFC